MARKVACTAAACIVSASSALAQVDSRAFSDRLYDISIYTAEEAAMQKLVAAEVDLVTARFLAQALAANGSRVPARAPAGWTAMQSALQAAVAPVAQKSSQERVAVLKAADLHGKAPYVREYEKLLRSSKPRNLNLQFSTGGPVVNGGQDQTADIPEILAFHEDPAAAKWRGLWPDLRAYAAHLLSLQLRLHADPGLGAGKSRKERLAVLLADVGGREVPSSEWEVLSAGRLGWTLAGMHRFRLPLGTELQEQGADLLKMGPGPGGTRMISLEPGRPLRFDFFDAGWDQDIAKRLSAQELQRIDSGLTARFVDSKNRWFAPLELEWDAHRAVADRVRQSSEMQAVSRRFAEAADKAMRAVWSTWQ